MALMKTTFHPENLHTESLHAWKFGRSIQGSDHIPTFGPLLICSAAFASTVSLLWLPVYESRRCTWCHEPLIFRERISIPLASLAIAQGLCLVYPSPRFFTIYSYKRFRPGVDVFPSSRDIQL